MCCKEVNIQQEGSAALFPNKSYQNQQKLFRDNYNFNKITGVNRIQHMNAEARRGTPTPSLS